MKNPDECRFAKSHEWIAADGTVGISDHAQREITDVVFVELPKVGRQITAGEAIAVVESVKAAFDIYSPVSGKITKINTAIAKNPAIVNKSPYGDGWLFSVEKTNPTEETNLMTHTQYKTFLEADSH